MEVDEIQYYEPEPPLGHTEAAAMPAGDDDDMQGAEETMAATMAEALLAGLAVTFTEGEMARGGGADSAEGGAAAGAATCDEQMEDAACAAAAGMAAVGEAI